MIHRAYHVQMPSNAAANPSIDIVVEGPVGTAALPVNNGTAAPAGWVGGDGQYYELRGRTLRIPARSAAGAAGGFVPRFRLGWNLSYYMEDLAPGATTDLPVVAYSTSLIPVGAFAVGLADPAYGPVIRLGNSAAIQARFVWVHLLVMEPSDEDRDQVAR